MDPSEVRLYGHRRMHNRRAPGAPGISIVIPTYNRRELLPGAIESAFGWLDALGHGEIICIDDASVDGTEQAIHDAYAGELAAGRLRFERLEVNAGATAAKNRGARLARSPWVVFLDSDDRLKPQAALPAAAALAAADTAPLVFFRCTSQEGGGLLGRREAQPLRIGLSAQIGGWRWGECLPVVRAEACRQFPYPEDLRGYEGLAYARMIRALGPALLSTVVARDYSETGLDRLSSAANLRRHGCLHARGRLRLLREFAAAMPILVRLGYFRGACLAAVNCLWMKLRSPARSRTGNETTGGPMPPPPVG